MAKGGAHSLGRHIFMLHLRKIVNSVCRCLPSSGKITVTRQASSVADGNRDGPILFLSPTNWPEPSSTAAGTRTMSLLRHFAYRRSVHFGCGAKLPDGSALSFGRANDETDGSNSAIHWHRIKPNRSEDMQRLLQTIQNDHGPIKAVVFDRFYSEEAYSFQIRELCPDALLVMDMQDAHSLRAGRQCLVELDAQRSSSDTKDRMTKDLMAKVMGYDPATASLEINIRCDNKRCERMVEKARDTFLRELASIHRSDLVLVCSSEEMKLLQSWNVPEWKLVSASFFCADEPAYSDFLASHSFEDRMDFVTVGGFKHLPNVDSVKLLRSEVWPRIRHHLPQTRLHVYGAYPTPSILAMHDEKSGFLVHGKVDDLDNALHRSRVLLAPLRYGAGVKGKIVDAWRCGCPVITTPVGAEGMRSTDGLDWGGLVASDTTEFVAAAIDLYTQKDLWTMCQDTGADLLQNLFNGKINLTSVESKVDGAIANLSERRRLDYIGSILWREGQRSTEYFSRWVGLKETIQKGRIDLY